MTGEVGIIYILHFDPKYLHAGHYLGWTSDLEKRITTHILGRGSPLVSAAVAAGASVVLARTWEGTRDMERTFHKRKNTPRLCPICREGSNDARV